MYRAGATHEGVQLENAVYLELRRRYGRLSETVITWVKTASGREADFAIDDPVKGGPPTLVQVCARLDDPSTRSREVAGLVEAMMELGTKPAVIVTMTDEEVIETDAGPIQVMPAREWFFRPTQG